LPFEALASSKDNIPTIPRRRLVQLVRDKAVTATSVLVRVLNVAFSSVKKDPAKVFLWQVIQFVQNASL
jgi:hypothetical protein